MSHYLNSEIEREISRNARVLLCTLTEIQAHYRFLDEARINKHLHDVWNVLVQVPEVRELCDLRYEKLMKEKGIVPDRAKTTPRGRSSPLRDG